MKFTLHREVLTNDYTLGSLFLDGSRYGYTCEDRDRKLEEDIGRKIKGQTAIPRGLYRIKATFSNRFQRLLPQILDVPGFEGIRIHGGNTSADTEGCVLLGEFRTADGVRLCSRLINDTVVLLLNAETAQEECWIEVK